MKWYIRPDDELWNHGWNDVLAKIWRNMEKHGETWRNMEKHGESWRTPLREVEAVTTSTIAMHRGGAIMMIISQSYVGSPLWSLLKIATEAPKVHVSNFKVVMQYLRCN